MGVEPVLGQKNSYPSSAGDGEGEWGECNAPQTA